MRLALIVMVFAAFMVMGAVRQPPTAALTQTPPIAQQEPTGSVEALSPTMFRFLEWAVTQGGLTLVLLFVLAAYRRDFFRKLEKKQEELDAKERERQDMKALLRENAAANQAHALAVLQNTNATDKLAQAVDRFAERRAPIQRRDGDT